jgi:plastocyanin
MKKDPGITKAVRTFAEALIFILFLTGLLSGCGKDRGGGVAAVQSTVKYLVCPSTGTTDIAVENEQFLPATVTIEVNDIVKWTNTGTGAWYWVASENVPGGTFNIDGIHPGESACLRFTAPGTYEYHCDPDVGGTVIVTAPTST